MIGTSHILNLIAVVLGACLGAGFGSQMGWQGVAGGTVGGAIVGLVVSGGIGALGDWHSKWLDSWRLDRPRLAVIYIVLSIHAIASAGGIVETGLGATPCRLCGNVC
jgi:hypothetical protein